MKTIRILAVAVMAVLAAAVTSVTGFTAQQPTYGQLEKESGASGFAPSADPDAAAGGWHPMEAPGHCVGCAEDSAPGQEGLVAGIIGPDLKK